MPTETFERLPEAKREQFLQAAFEEFALHDYRSASVSRIVAILGIAKGSVYQYFRDKGELYAYLLDLASAQKLTWVRERSPGDASTPDDFFLAYRAYLIESAAFDLTHPRMSLLLINALQESPASEARPLVEIVRRRALDSLLRFIQGGMEAGAVRKDLEPLALATYLNALSLAVAPYLEAKLGFSLQSLLAEGAQRPPYKAKDLASAVDGLVAVLKDGMGPR